MLESKIFLTSAFTGHGRSRDLPGRSVAWQDGLANLGMIAPNGTFTARESRDQTNS
jgi:hypothetical protein